MRRDWREAFTVTDAHCQRCHARYTWRLGMFDGGLCPPCERAYMAGKFELRVRLVPK